MSHCKAAEDLRHKQQVNAADPCLLRRALRCMAKLPADVTYSWHVRVWQNVCPMPGISGREFAVNLCAYKHISVSDGCDNTARLPDHCTTFAYSNASDARTLLRLRQHWNIFHMLIGGPKRGSLVDWKLRLAACQIARRLQPTCE